MLGNQIGAGVGSVPDFIENHRAGKLRIVVHHSSLEYAGT